MHSPVWTMIQFNPILLQCDGNQQRSGDALVAIDPIELVNHQKSRHQGHFDRQHQGAENGKQNETVTGEAKLRKTGCESYALLSLATTANPHAARPRIHSFPVRPNWPLAARGCRPPGERLCRYDG
jgi:hypothetical protein